MHSTKTKVPDDVFAEWLEELPHPHEMLDLNEVIDILSWLPTLTTGSELEKATAAKEMAAIYQKVLDRAFESKFAPGEID